MSAEPYKVEHTKRQVLEKQLLTSLAGGDKVAILATKEDLDVMIHALTVARPLNQKLAVIHADLREGMEILRKEAFP